MDQKSIWQKLVNHSLRDMDVGISPDRLMALTDGVFAVGLTMLILTITLPTSTFENSTSMVNFLQSSLDYFITVTISFVILGEYWIQHHNFMKLKRINIPFLWLNICYLLLIMFIPFTTTIICRYKQFSISEVIFGLIICLTSIVSLIMYWYASKSDLLDEANEIEKRYTIKSLSSLIYVTIIICILIIFVSHQLIILFLIIPIYSIYLAMQKDKIYEIVSSPEIETFEKPDILANIKKDKIIEFMLSSKIEDYINENYKNYEELDEEEKKEIHVEALDDLKVQLDKIIEEGKKEIKP